MNKTILLLVMSFCCLPCMAQHGTQFENRGFETWANFGNGASTIEPSHWHSTKSASGTFSGFLSQQIEPSSQTRPGSSGSQSARLWPVSVVGVTANGNLTNGRMNAGSMSATGSNNYNYTQRSDERFNTPIDRVPDSLTVWVCFRSVSTTQQGSVEAIVHGDVDLQVLASGEISPSDKVVAIASQPFLRTGTPQGGLNWRRLSIPFSNNGACHDPRYILCSITTNEVPGEGSTSDELYVDDILLVYNPSLQMGSLDKDHYLIGETLSVPFTLEGTMSAENLNEAPNRVIAQLSSPNGGFSDPIELGCTQTNTSGSLSVSIPSGIPEGEHYRIRVVSTNYPMVSGDNGADLSITSPAGTPEYRSVTLEAYPNPTHDILRLRSNEEIRKIDVFNQLGERVASFQPHANEVELPLAESKMAPGLYFAQCHFDNALILKKFLLTPYF